MNQGLFLIFIGLLCSFNVKCYPDAQIAFDTVDEEDREHFISLHLAIGLMETDEMLLRMKLNLPDDIHIPEEIFEELKEVKVPDDFSIDLYLWTKQTFKLNDDDVYVLVTSGQVCKPNTMCVTSLDIGSLCCPF